MTDPSTEQWRLSVLVFLALISAGVNDSGMAVASTIAACLFALALVVSMIAERLDKRERR